MEISDRGALVNRKDGDNLGISVALSGNGDTLAIGAPTNDRNGIDAGVVHTFSFGNYSNKWAHFGQTILGDEPSSGFGIAISLSKDSKFIAVGDARKTGVNETHSAGGVYLYEQA